VAVVLGAVAAAGGWYGRRMLVAIAGIGYLLAAVAQAALIGRHGDPLGGDGSTVSFWLGLGVRLLALAATGRPAQPPAGWGGAPGGMRSGPSASQRRIRGVGRGGWWCPTGHRGLTLNGCSASCHCRGVAVR